MGKLIPTPATLKPWACMIEMVEHTTTGYRGYRVYLEPGWVYGDEHMHSFRRPTLIDCANVMKRYITRCQCDACKVDLANITDPGAIIDAAEYRLGRTGEPF